MRLARDVSFLYVNRYPWPYALPDGDVSISMSFKLQRRDEVRYCKKQQVFFLQRSQQPDVLLVVDVPLGKTSGPVPSSTTPPVSARGGDTAATTRSNSVSNLQKWSLFLTGADAMQGLLCATSRDSNAWCILSRGRQSSRNMAVHVH